MNAPLTLYFTLGHEVVEVGSVVKDKFSWFSGSPDGLIIDKTDAPGTFGILEIKCIYSCRDGGKIKGCKFLDKTQSYLRTGSNYYTQVQMNAWVTGASYINLFLFTHHDCKTIHVPLDMEHV